MIALPSGHPEFVDAERMLLGVGEPVGRIHRVYSAGDPLAVSLEGIPRDTILYLRFRNEDDDVGEPWTALLLPGGRIRRRMGWA